MTPFILYSFKKNWYQAANLIQQLASPGLLIPRLEIPFELWAGLIQHDGWRQQLVERRRGLPEQRSVLQWLQRGAEGIVWEVSPTPEDYLQEILRF